MNNWLLVGNSLFAISAAPFSGIHCGYVRNAGHLALNSQFYESWTLAHSSNPAWLFYVSPCRLRLLPLPLYLRVSLVTENMLDGCSCSRKSGPLVASSFLSLSLSPSAGKASRLNWSVHSEERKTSRSPSNRIGWQWETLCEYAAIKAKLRAQPKLTERANSWLEQNLF